MKSSIIISTYPNKKSVTKVANDMVKNRHAVCVNFTKIQSIYSWKKKIENASEYLAIFKTTKKNSKKLKLKIKQTHPYAVPEIAEIDVSSINNSYLKWLVDSTL